MRVFITGAAGFVGRQLAPRLAAEGHAVLGTDVEVDITDRDALATTLRAARPDAIVHLAAQSSVAASWRDPASCFRVNFLGTKLVLECVRELAPKARVLLIGSADQYGTSQSGARPCDETQPLRPVSPYARTKAAAEQLGSLAARRGLDVVRIRAFNHTGPGQAEHFVASSFARQVAEIEAGLQPAVMRVGNLDSVRDFLDVRDVLDAYVALLDPTVPADVYNVASEEAVSIRRILALLLDLAKIRPEVETDPERMRPTDQLVGDATRLRNATGWSPQISLSETLRSLLDDWRGRLATAAPH